MAADGKSPICSMRSLKFAEIGQILCLVFGIQSRSGKVSKSALHSITWVSLGTDAPWHLYLVGASQVMHSMAEHAPETEFMEFVVKNKLSTVFFRSVNCIAVLWPLKTLPELFKVPSPSTHLSRIEVRCGQPS